MRWPKLCIVNSIEAKSCKTAFYACDNRSVQSFNAYLSFLTIIVIIVIVVR